MLRDCIDDVDEVGEEGTAMAPALTFIDNVSRLIQNFLDLSGLRIFKFYSV